MTDIAVPRTSRQRQPRELGAQWRTVPSPYGNTAVREEWQARIDAITTLATAVSELQQWRAGNQTSMQDQDFLWIEAKLEERVAVLRFSEMSDEEIRSRTLTGEDAEQVCASYLARAAAESGDYYVLERINNEFRARYKPPIMPTNPFMRTEVQLCEALMKLRSLDWYGKSIEQLRQERGVIVHASPELNTPVHSFV